MSADNYLYVRKRDDGRYGVSMRFASGYYRDEIDPDDWPQDQATYTGSGPVDELGFAPIPEEWVEDAPDDRYGVYDTAAEALNAAYREESDSWCEYGVSIGDGVLGDVEA